MFSEQKMQKKSFTEQRTRTIFTLFYNYCAQKYTSFLFKVKAFNYHNLEATIPVYTANNIKKITFAKHNKEQEQLINRKQINNYKEFVPFLFI